MSVTGIGGRPLRNAEEEIAGSAMQNGPKVGVLGPELLNHPEPQQSRVKWLTCDFLLRFIQCRKALEVSIFETREPPQEENILVHPNQPATSYIAVLEV